MVRQFSPEKEEILSRIDIIEKEYPEEKVRSMMAIMILLTRALIKKSDVMIHVPAEEARSISSAVGDDLQTV